MERVNNNMSPESALVYWKQHYIRRLTSLNTFFSLVKNPYYLCNCHANILLCTTLLLCMLLETILQNFIRNNLKSSIYKGYMLWPSNSYILYNSGTISIWFCSIFNRRLSPFWRTIGTSTKEAFMSLKTVSHTCW